MLSFFSLVITNTILKLENFVLVYVIGFFLSRVIFIDEKFNL
jgi:hypothetical protein